MVKRSLLTKSPTEQRQEARLSGNLRVYVEFSLDGSDFESELIEAKVVDFSANGVQLLLSSVLPETALLNLYCVIPEQNDPLHLIAEVRWCRPSRIRDDLYLVGFIFFESDGSEIGKWKLLVADWLDAG